MSHNVDLKILIFKFSGSYYGSHLCAINSQKGLISIDTLTQTLQGPIVPYYPIIPFEMHKYFLCDCFNFCRFISDYLNKNDPQHRRWYISTRQENKNQWINQGDGTQMLNLDKFFHPANEWGEFDQV